MVDIKKDLELILESLGADFTTFRGRQVVYKGDPDLSYFFNWVPIGSIGEILYTMPGHYAEVQVRWKVRSNVNGWPSPIYAHRWAELELSGAEEVKSDE